jgi:hypothetical protein
VRVTLGITSLERVVRVGSFRPLAAKRKATGCRLDVVDLTPTPEEALTPEQGEMAFAHCDVALISGTSLINGT